MDVEILKSDRKCVIMLIDGDVYVAGPGHDPELIKIPINDWEWVPMNRENVSNMTYQADENILTLPEEQFATAVEDVVCSVMGDENHWNGTVSFWRKSNASMRMISFLENYFEKELSKANEDAWEYVHDLEMNAIAMEIDTYDEAHSDNDWHNEDTIVEFSRWFYDKCHTIDLEEVIEKTREILK